VDYRTAGTFIGTRRSADPPVQLEPTAAEWFRPEDVHRRLFRIERRQTLPEWAAIDAGGTSDASCLKRFAFGLHADEARGRRSSF
jgi:hypothetical protein